MDNEGVIPNGPVLAWEQIVFEKLRNRNAIKTSLYIKYILLGSYIPWKSYVISILLMAFPFPFHHYSQILLLTLTLSLGSLHIHISLFSPMLTLNSIHTSITSGVSMLLIIVSYLTFLLLS